MEANKDIAPDYRKDMCPITLENLAKVVYFPVSPDDTKEELDAKAAMLRAALNNA